MPNEVNVCVSLNISRDSSGSHGLPRLPGQWHQVQESVHLSVSITPGQCKNATGDEGTGPSIPASGKADFFSLPFSQVRRTFADGLSKS